jgi:endonuclease/exonuclease/phosphatase family metal-dependent hydrolase
MRFLLYNIRYATGHKNGYHLPLPYTGFFKQTSEKLNKITHFIKSSTPDIIGLVEVDSGSYRSGNSCQAKKIAEELHYSHVVETKYANNSLAQKLPVLKQQSNALLARGKFLNHQFHYFEEGVKRLVIQAELENVIVFIVHLSIKYRHRQNQLKHLHHLIKGARKPIIVAGDFNTFWGNRELELFLAASRLHNANPDNRPSHPSHSPHRQIDFILHSSELQVDSFSIPDIQLSDHNPVICDFSMKHSSS